MNGNGVLLLAVNESQRLQFSQSSAQGLFIPEFQAGCLVVQLDNQTLYYWNGENYEILASTGGSGPGVASLNSLIGALNIVAGSNITVTPSGQNITIASTGGGGGSGTVTSVGLTVPSYLSVSGSPITTAGTLAISGVSQPANYFLASPDGSSGVLSPRAIVAADIPTLNQNTTGTASNITATSNNTLATLSSLSLPYSQITGTPSPVTPGGSSGQIQFNNAGAFGGFGSWDGTNFNLTGNIMASGTLYIGSSSQFIGNIQASGGLSVSGNLGFYGVTQIAQPSGDIITALSNLGLVAAGTISGTDIPIDNNTIYVNGSGDLAVQYSIINPTNSNYFFGYHAGNISATGTTDIGFGETALSALTSGYSNSAFGYAALSAVTSGFYNTGIGSVAATLLTTGNSNTAVGYNSLSNAVSATGNTAIGREALKATTGNSNTSVGYESLFYNTTGTNNTAIGYQAGHSSAGLITATDITLLGAGTGNSGSDGITNSTAIGFGASINASNQIMLGNSSVTTIQTGTPSVLWNGSSPMTTAGDVEYYNSGVQRLGIGTSGQVLTAASGLPVWQTLTAAQIAGGPVGYVITGNGTSSAPTWEAVPGTGAAFFGSSFITSGVTYTTPGSITTSTGFKFTLIGGGGGGGGINTASANGSGGGGGQVVTIYATGLSPSTAYTIAIGGAGTGGISTTTPATAGGNTTISLDSITYTAAGGGAGADTVSTAGGAGGNAANTFGTGFSTGGFQIQGKAGRGSTLANADSFSGDGGEAMAWGAGGAPYTSSTAGNGNPGTGYGGGGSGGRGAAATGGAGSAGAILVEYHN